MEYLEQDLPAYDRKEIIDLWADDKLERMDCARNLTGIISQTNADKDSFTLVVKSPWGTGKTFFVQKWIETLRRQKVFCVYLSAWEAELYEKPALYFFEQFIKAFQSEPELFSETDERTEKILLKAFLLIPVLLMTFGDGLNWALRSCISHLNENFQRFINGKLVELNSEATIYSSIATVKARLGELIQEISESTFDNRVYVFVDELDRCKPDFAIKILEEMKHFFSLPDLVFVLSLDMEQLEGSIKHVYGQHIDCESYLMRFINLFYTLPPISYFSFAKHLTSQISEMPDTLKMTLGRDNNAVNSFESIFSILSAAFSASLRDQLMILTRLKLMLTAGKVFLFPTLYFLFFQLKYPKTWQNVQMGQLDCLKTSIINTFLNENKLPTIKILLSDAQKGLLDETVEVFCMTNETDQENHIDNAIESVEVKRGNYRHYWQLIADNRPDFLQQIRLVNLYSDCFGN